MVSPYKQLLTALNTIPFSSKDHYRWKSCHDTMRPFHTCFISLLSLRHSITIIIKSCHLSPCSQSFNLSSNYGISIRTLQDDIFFRSPLLAHDSLCAQSVFTPACFCIVLESTPALQAFMICTNPILYRIICVSTMTFMKSKLWQKI